MASALVNYGKQREYWKKALEKRPNVDAAGKQQKRPFKSHTDEVNTAEGRT